MALGLRTTLSLCVPRKGSLQNKASDHDETRWMEPGHLTSLHTGHLVGWKLTLDVNDMLELFIQLVSILEFNKYLRAHTYYTMRRFLFYF